MSPTPPNKDSTANGKEIKPQSIQNDQVNTDGFEVIDNDQMNNEEANSATATAEERDRNYRPLEQNPSATNEADDDEEDDDSDDETDSEPEIDPDEHFGLLASSRATAMTKNTTPSSKAELTSYSHLFETDVFERKIVLESEEIHLDEEKTKKINDLMQNFKLPEESVPSWAKLVPEDVWKKNLLDCLNAKKLDLFNLPPAKDNQD